MRAHVSESKSTHSITPSRVHPVATPGYAYTSGRLTCAGVDVTHLADTVGTPCYAYDAGGMRDRYRAFARALAPLKPDIRYAVKANPNLGVVRLFADLGAGMDVVSIGELERAWLAGAPMESICFAGVAKGDDELRAALDPRFSPIAGSGPLIGIRDPAGRGPIGLINAESESEIRRCSAIAVELGAVVHYTIRLNPGITAGANDKVRVGKTASKFGLPPEDVLAMAERCAALPGTRLRGIHMHIGSQIDNLARYDDALHVLNELVDRLLGAGHPIDTLNVGAGVAVSYVGERAPTDDEYAGVLRTHLRQRVDDGIRILVEPGRELVAQAGVLLTRIRHVKRAGTRTIITTDAGLNALVRPAMYGAQHTILPAQCPEHLAPDPIAPLVPGIDCVPVDIVGPVCESSDVFARDWPLPPLSRGDVLAVFTAGAYGMSMAMTFNDLPMPAEVMIDAGRARVIREHQSYEHMLAPTLIGLHGGRSLDLP